MTFLKTNLITLFSKLICLASALFISVYIARFIGPSAKGIYYLLVQVVSILATISLFGVDTAAIYYLGKGYSPRGVAFLSNLITIIVSIAVTLLFFLMIRGPYVVVIAAVIPLMAAARLSSAMLMGFNRFLAFNLLNILLYLILAASFIIFVIYAKLGLLGALISYASAYLIMVVVYNMIIFGSERMKVISNVTLNPGMLLGYGSRVFLVPILLIIIYRVDSFMLGYYIDAAAVGFYSVALSFAELLLFIPESTGTILFPKLAYTEPESVNKKFISILRISIILTAAAAALFFITIRYILPFVYGNLYFESVKLTYLLLPGLLVMSVYYLFSSYFQAIGKPGFVTFVLAVILIEKAVLCYLLIPKFGSAGAALASTISYSTCFLIFLSAFRSLAKFKAREILALKDEDVNLIRSSLNNIFDFQK